MQGQLIGHAIDVSFYFQACDHQQERFRIVPYRVEADRRGTAKATRVRRAQGNKFEISMASP